MRLCLVALNAYPALEPRVSGPIGGIETRSWMLARGLASRPGVSVQFVVRHHEPLLQTTYDGVELVPLIDPLYPLWQSAGHCLERRTRFPWVRVKRWEPRLLWQLPRLALDRLRRGRVYAADAADPRLVALPADLFGTLGVQTHSAVVIRSAHAAGKPTLLFLGSDGDLDPIFETGGEGTDPYGTRADVGRWILQSADFIVAQTRGQQSRLKERFGRDAVVLESPIDVAAWDAGRGQTVAAQQPGSSAAARLLGGGLRDYVLWIGRAEDVHKRPQLCLELAQRLPDTPFLMILNPRDAAVETRIRAEAPDNLHIVDRVPFPEMPFVFSRASALLSTSHLEGFPNVFLQAAISRAPIVSLEVGEAFLTSSRAGICAGGDIDRAAEALARICRREADPDIDTAAARQYVIDHHSLPRQIERLQELLAAWVAPK